MNFEIVFFLPIYGRKSQSDEKLVERQMIKVLAQPIINVEQFC